MSKIPFFGDTAARKFLADNPEMLDEEIERQRAERIQPVAPGELDPCHASILLEIANA